MALLGVLALAAVTVVTWLVWHVTIFAVELAAKLVSACFGAVSARPTLLLVCVFLFVCSRERVRANKVYGANLIRFVSCARCHSAS